MGGCGRAGARAHVFARATSSSSTSSTCSQQKMAYPRPSVYIIGVGMSKFSKPAEGNDEYGTFFSLLGPLRTPRALSPGGSRRDPRRLRSPEGWRSAKSSKSQREGERESDGRKRRKREG